MIRNQAKSLEHFYGHFHRPLTLLIIAFGLEFQKVFLNHWNNFFSQKVRRNFETKYQRSAEFCTCDTMHMLLTTQ